MKRKIKYSIRKISAIKPAQCPCGSTRRAFHDDPDKIASLHVVEIKANSMTHYHKKLTEIYYILKGRGRIELDGRKFAVTPGTTILIKPGCRHRAVGKLKVITVPIPAFDPHDEWFD